MHFDITIVARAGSHTNKTFALCLMMVLVFQVLVIAAFEFTSDNYTEVPENKEDLIRMWDSKAIRPFQ